MLACMGGRMDIVKLILINPGINVNKRDHEGINAVYVCAYFGHYEILKLIKSCGGKFYPNHKGSTALHIAAKKGYLEIVKFILKQKNDPIPIDTVNKNGMTPALLAAQKNNLKILDLLKETGANLQKQVPEQGGVNILYLAAQQGHVQIVNYLLDNNVIKNPN